MSCTFQGHSLAVASALAVQSIILETGFISKVNSNGKYIRNVLRDQLSTHPFVKDIRGRGVRNSIEYGCKNVDQFSKLIGSILFDKYNIICSSKWHRTSFCHAMNLEIEEINLYLEQFLDAFKSAADRWGNDSNVFISNRHNF